MARGRPATLHGRGLRAAGVLLPAVLVLAVVAGCSAERAQPNPALSRPSPSASPTLSGARAEAADKALAAYAGFYREYVKATADPSKPPGLAKFAGYPLRTEAGLYLRQMKQQGQVSRGEPKLAPKVTAVSDDVRHVRIADCFDNNGATVVVKATGQNVTAPGQAQRYVSVAQADLYADGSWLVSKITPQRSTPC